MHKIFLLIIVLLLPWAYFLFNRHQMLVLPGAPVALVLGAGLRARGPSPILQSRLDTAVSLYNSQKIRFIIVSGDNREVSYNEPEVMKNYLVGQGIPENAIIKDFGGRRTVDSCWRAKNVFKASLVHVVTQEFHMPRSVFLCQKEGLEVVATPALIPNSGSALYLNFREFFASWRSLFELLGYEPAIKSNGTEIDLSKL